MAISGTIFQAGKRDILEFVVTASFVLTLPSILVSCGDRTVSLEELEKLAEETRPDNTYEAICAVCHGGAGEGKEEQNSPSIAGLPAWYMEEQMNKFRDGTRGFHRDDIPGQTMRAISLSLTPEQIRDAAETASRFPKILTEAPPAGTDLTIGRRIYARECMACHRYNGTGEATFHSAQLIALNRTYLRRQLLNYRDGKRGATEGDIYGNKMVMACANLRDHEIEMLVDYIGALAHGDDPRNEMER